MTCVNQLVSHEVRNVSKGLSANTLHRVSDQCGSSDVSHGQKCR